MLYAMLIFQSDDLREELSDAEFQELLGGHRALQESTKAVGAFVAATQLAGTETATVVRRRSDEILVTDGPFAETKEVLVGFYVFECADLDEAIALAGRIPHASTGAIEVRLIEYLETHSKTTD